MLWDVFCQVIDNHGDAGVCWRLCAQLGALGHEVRLRIDDPSALGWMAPQGAAGVRILPFASSQPPGDVAIEAFGCELPPAFQAAMVEALETRGSAPRWINLEYLTAETFAERSHGLPSPVLAGPGKGLAKRFFYPGFTASSGGLLREPDLLQRRAAFDREAWLRGQDIPFEGERLVSLFCYEPQALPVLLRELAGGPATRLLVTAGRAAAAARDAIDRLDAAEPTWNSMGLVRFESLPLLTQADFDHLLWACDFNFVRGEDSLVRALWAGKPFCWQLYPQHDGAHLAKLEAFLEWLSPQDDWATLFRSWNGAADSWPGLRESAWARGAAAARDRLLAQDDLVSRLLRFPA